jgi:hypothetical protein
MLVGEACFPYDEHHHARLSGFGMDVFELRFCLQGVSSSDGSQRFNGLVGKETDLAEF